jgi:hypothetical protein
MAKHAKTLALLDAARAILADTHPMTVDRAGSLPGDGYYR